MEVALLADSHFGARGESLVFDDYFHTFYSKVFFPILEQRNIKTILHLGDLVDKRKGIGYNILHRFRTKFMLRLKDDNINMYGIIGNHDATFRNTNEINALHELLVGWDNVTIVDEPLEIELEKTKFLLVPWINQENEDVVLGAIRRTKANILCGHFEINGFQMYPGKRCENGYNKDLFSKFKAVFSGHFHHKSSDENIHYLGSPYQMTFSDLNDPKGFHILDTETGDLTFIENPNIMFHRVYYDDKGKSLDKVLVELIPTDRFKNSYVKVVVVNKTNPYYFDRFIDTLFQICPIDVKIVEDFTFDNAYSDDDCGVNQAEDTLTILSNYVDLQLSMENHQKDKIKDILRTLYIEANQLEV